MPQPTSPTVVEFPKNPPKAASSHERIWGKPVLTHGYTALPSILIQAQSRLGITPLQFNILGATARLLAGSRSGALPFQGRSRRSHRV